jgi:hypothetical protein
MALVRASAKAPAVNAGDYGVTVLPNKFAPSFTCHCDPRQNWPERLKKFSTEPACVTGVIEIHYLTSSCCFDQ